MKKNIDQSEAADLIYQALREAKENGGKIGKLIESVGIDGDNKDCDVDVTFVNGQTFTFSSNALQDVGN